MAISIFASMEPPKSKTGNISLSGSMQVPEFFCFISSSRSVGVGINLTRADPAIFYDSDFSPQMDKQCEDQ
ncbi:hypothetical protein EV702DRAFT_1196486 [Suillus placidus]|uniref:Uncharacterized protein n=1 Tax=Suillus placidus TaxID=48579 RepID=A0A9P6ZWX9_9AGAM|nr:hypothetical protein EV702DRAFT_1196486 [Suillus placidus]